MNGPSLERFGPKVAKGGTIVVNTSLVSQIEERPSVRIVRLPMNEIAQELGEPRCANMVGLGAVIKALGLFPLDAVALAMEEELGARGREKLVAINKEALLRGYSLSVEGTVTGALALKGTGPVVIEGGPMYWVVTLPGDGLAPKGVLLVSVKIPAAADIKAVVAKVVGYKIG
jgi:hypothetical protein